MVHLYQRRPDLLTTVLESRASVENEELSQLFSAAMEATDRRAEEARVARGDAAEEADDFEDDFDLDVEVESTSLGLDIDYLREQILKASPQGIASDDHSEDISAKGSAAADSTDEQIDRLLAGSFGSVVSDDDPDLAFPDFDDEIDEIDEIDDDGGMPASALEALNGSIDSEALTIAQQQTASLRRQFNQISQSLADRDLELQTTQDRVVNLEAQVVQATRQTAAASREFQAFRLRAERETEDARKFATEKILKDLLGVLDNLERALEHAGEQQRDSALATGVEMTLEQFIGILERGGATRVIPVQGESFDPNFHEAVGQEAHESIVTGSIVRALQQGLVLNGRLVRAAMVVVSTGDGSDVVAAAPARAAAGAEATPDEQAGPPKKKRRKKKRKGAAQAGGAELEAAALGDANPLKKKKRRKKKRKTKSAETLASEVEQTSTEQPTQG